MQQAFKAVCPHHATCSCFYGRRCPASLSFTKSIASISDGGEAALPKRDLSVQLTLPNHISRTQAGRWLLSLIYSPSVKSDCKVLATFGKFTLIAHHVWQPKPTRCHLRQPRHKVRRLVLPLSCLFLSKPRPTRPSHRPRARPQHPAEPAR